MENNLKELINQDKNAMRAKDAKRLGTIRLLLSAIKQKEVDERVVVDNLGVVSIVDKMIKQRKDSIAAFQKAERADLVDNEQFEVSVLQAYLPQRMSDAEVEASVRNIVSQMGDVGAGDMGKVMGAVKKELNGKAEMATVSAVVKKVLAG